MNRKESGFRNEIVCREDVPRLCYKQEHHFCVISPRGQGCSESILGPMKRHNIGFYKPFNMMFQISVLRVPVLYGAIESLHPFWLTYETEFWLGVSPNYLHEPSRPPHVVTMSTASHRWSRHEDQVMRPLKFPSASLPYTIYSGVGRVPIRELRH